MAKSGEVVVLTSEFDYTRLEPKVAGQVRETAERIRVRLKKTLEDLVSVGNELRAVKEALEHGQFGRWLQAEFYWTERMARNFMAVAERFGETELISDLQIQPTAAYLLAAPSVPDEARQEAVERARAGELISAKGAKEIVTKSRKRLRRRRKPLPPDRFIQRLLRTLERQKARRGPKDLANLSQELRAFADAVDRERLEKVRSG